MDQVKEAVSRVSKAASAKEVQGYDPKPEPRTCGSCANFKSDRVLPDWMREARADWAGRPYTLESHGVEKNLRCGLGGFAVKKMASCNEFKRKERA